MTNIKETRFVCVTPDSKKDEAIILHSIAEHLGLRSKRLKRQTGSDPSLVDKEEVLKFHRSAAQARAHRRKELVDMDLCRKYVGDTRNLDITDPKKVDRSFSENWQHVLQHADALANIPAVSASFGTSYPSYYEAIQGYFKPGEIKKALMLGAQTTDTIREFVAGVKGLQPQAECYVIDRSGCATAKTPKSLATWTKDDATNLRFESDQFQLVVANFLATALVGPYNIEVPFPYYHKKQVEETLRVLTPGGIYVAVENINFEDTLVSLMQDAGFENIGVVSAIEFRTRRAMSKFFKGTHPSIITTDLFENPDAIVISGTKPTA